MMWYWGGGGIHWWGWFIGFILTVGFWALIIFLIVSLFRSSESSRSRASSVSIAGARLRCSTCPISNHETIATKELGSRQKLRIRATVVEDHRRYQGHGTPPRIRATVKLSPSVAFGKRPGQSGSTQATDSPPP